MRDNQAGLSTHARTVLLATFALFFSGYLLLSIQAARWFAEASRQLEDARPRYARLAGLRQSAELIRSTASQSQRQVDDMVYSASADMASVSALVQQDVRVLLEGAGLSVSGSRVLEVVEHENFVQIPVEFTASGPMDSFAAALVAIRQVRPLLLLDGLDIKPARGRRNQPGPQAQTVELAVQVSVVKLS
jgi:hypothetical protein